MKRRYLLVTVVLALFLALAGTLIGGHVLAPEQSGMPVPGLDDGVSGIEESIVEDGEQSDVSLDMPVPGTEGVPEMIVGGEEEAGTAGSGMPVPGLPGVEESIVIEE